MTDTATTAPAAVRGRSRLRGVSFLAQYAGFLPALVLFGLFFALPLGLIVAYSFWETIDYNTRAMNIKTDAGETVAVTAPKSVTRFPELKVGDHVKATYNNNVSVRLKPPGEAPVDTVEPAFVKGGATSGTKSVVRRMTATVVALDPNASSISFQAPNGWNYSRRVVDPEVFNQVKVGDQVDITWNTDLTVEVVR